MHQRNKQSNNYNNKVKDKGCNQLPEGYLKEGYFNNNQSEKTLKVEYILKYPKEIVEILQKEQRRGKNKTTQIRKYYNFCMRLKTRVGNSYTKEKQVLSFEKLKVELESLKYFVYDAHKRDKVTSVFKEFIEKNVDAIKDNEDFLAFVKHFEAVMAYLPKEKN